MSQTKTLKFHYIKSSFFRVMHVDGMIGGPTPHGNLHLAFYSERPAILQSSEQELAQDGTLSPPIERGKDGFVREMDCDLVMSPAVAEGLRDWLTERLKEFDSLIEDQPSIASKDAG